MVEIANDFLLSPRALMGTRKKYKLHLVRKNNENKKLQA